MKKLSLIALFISVVFIFSGCGLNNTKDSEVTTETSKKQTREKNLKDDVKKNKDEYKKKYVDFLTDYKKSSEFNENSSRFQLIYLDDDDIPEIAIANDFSHGSGVIIYMYSEEGEVLKITDGVGFYGTFEYCSKGNIVSCNTVHSDIATTIFYKIRNNELNEIAMFDEDLLAGVVAERPESDKYKYKGEVVSEKEYNSRKNKLDERMDNSLIVCNLENGYNFSDENIKNVVNKNIVLTENIDNSNVLNEDITDESIPNNSVENINVEDEVKIIRSMYNNTQDNLDKYLEGHGVNSILYYDGAYPVKIIVEKDDNFPYVREYYFNGDSMMPYFVFLYDGNIEHRFYYKGETLIRYIDNNKTIFDYGQTDAFSHWTLKFKEDITNNYMVNCGA